MEFKTFDHFLKHKMNQHKSRFKESDWDSFNEMRSTGKHISKNSIGSLFAFVSFFLFFSGLNPKEKLKLTESQEKIGLLKMNIGFIISSRELIENQIASKAIENKENKPNRIGSKQKYSLNPTKTITYENSIPLKDSSLLARKFLTDFQIISPSKNSYPLIISSRLISAPNKFIMIPKIEGKQQTKDPTFQGGKIQLRLVGSINLSNINQPFSLNTFTLGAFISKNISTNLGIRAGLSYSQYADDFGSRQYNKTLYDFGITFQTTRISAYQLNYLELPVTFYYSLKKKSELQFGFSSGLLLQSLNKVSIIKTGDQNSVETYNQKGYVSAYTPYDFSLISGYNYAITKHLYLQITGKVGLLDISNNRIFRSEHKNKINAISLGIHYAL
jgi:hypothetical protein